MLLQVNNFKLPKTNLYQKNTSGLSKHNEILITSNTSNIPIANNYYYNKVSFSGISKIPTLAEKIQKERDEIFMLLDYSLIHKNWQPLGGVENRGFNIGAILVDPKGKVVDTNLNSVLQDSNRTHHSEMNLIQGYLDKHPEQKGFLEDFSIYTSLEPCAMCSGTMLQTGIGKVIYGLNDPEYGGTIPRLLSNRSKKYIPYPTRTKKLIYKEAPDSISKEIRMLYTSDTNHPPKIVKWLNLDSVKELFFKASKKLEEFKTEFSENDDTLAQAKLILKNKSLS